MTHQAKYRGVLLHAKIHAGTVANLRVQTFNNSSSDPSIIVNKARLKCFFPKDLEIASRDHPVGCLKWTTYEYASMTTCSAAYVYDKQLSSLYYMCGLTFCRWSV